MFNNIKVGIAPINWTNDDDPSLGGDVPFEQCIREMQESGYVGCEVGNKFPRDPQTLHAALEPLNLQIASAWVSVYFTEEDRYQASITAFAKHLDFLKAMGAKVIVICECGHCIQGSDQPILGAKPVFSEQQWQQLIDGLHAIGQMAKQQDMQIVYHAHMGTGVQTEAELDRLMQGTDADLVSLLLDTGHIVYGGGDPLAIIQKHSKRIKHVHLKDLRRDMIEEVRRDRLSFMDGVRLGTFTTPGDGMIDFAPIFKALSASHYQGWFIVEAEQDPVKAPPLAYATQARKFIRELIGI